MKSFQCSFLYACIIKHIYNNNIYFHIIKFFGYYISDHCIYIVREITTGTGSLSFLAPYIKFSTKYHALFTSRNNILS